MSRILVFVLLITCIGCTSEEKKYYDNGNLKSIGELEDNMRQGTWVFFTDDGDTSEVHIYDGGEIIKRNSYVNGNLFLSESLKDEKRHGETIAYYANGLIRSKGFYKEGVEDGQFSAYYEDGTIKATGENKEGKLIGDFKQYYQNGNLFISSNNVGNGIHHVYDSSGNKTYDLLYENGELVDTLKVY